MIYKSLVLASVLVMAACAAAPPAERPRPLDLRAAAQADNKWAPPVTRSETAPVPGFIGQPMALAKLVEDRLEAALTAEDKRLIDDAANRALNAADSGDKQDWDNPRTGHHGEIILASRDAMGDGRTCAILHHTHVFASQTIRGSVTLCRRAGEPWLYQELRWLRTGGDMVLLLPDEERPAHTPVL